jgi:hypothetical protein
MVILSKFQEVVSIFVRYFSLLEFMYTLTVKRKYVGTLSSAIFHL